MADFPVGYLIKRIRLLIRSRLDESLAHHQLTASTNEVHFHLDQKGARGASELDRLAAVTPQTMHRQARQLLKAG